MPRESFWREGEIVELGRCFDAAGLGVERMHGVRAAREEGVRNVRQLIERYGDDGMGDKPPEISRVVYWFQHLDLERLEAKVRMSEARAEKRAAKRQRL